MALSRYVDTGYYTPEGADGYAADTVYIHWGDRIIHVPTAFLYLVSAASLVPLRSEVYRLDVNEFRLVLKDLEDGDSGIVFGTTHNHNTTVDLSGITLARVVEIINGYSVEFEDGQYAVNIVGGNTNIAAVTNVNDVSVRPFNSAGLVQVPETVVVPPVWPAVVDANLVQITSDATVPILMKIAASTMIVGTVSAVVSATQFRVAFTSFSTEETTSLTGRRIIFVDGNQKHEASRITAYDGAGGGHGCVADGDCDFIGTSDW